MNIAFKADPSHNVNLNVNSHSNLIVNPNAYAGPSSRVNRALNADPSHCVDPNVNSHTNLSVNPNVN